MTVLPRLTRMPDQSQNLATTPISRCMSAAELQTIPRSSAKPRAGVRRPVMVLWPTPVVFNASRSALNMRPKSRGDSLSPCFVPRVR